MACVLLLVGLLDFATGPELSFFLFYFLPIGMAAWSLGLKASVISSVICSLVWFLADLYSSHGYSSLVFPVWNLAIRLSAFLVVGWSLHKIRFLLDSQAASTAALRSALAEVRVLEELLPICAWCKKIRDSQGQWQPLETYISQRTDTAFTHGACPECARKFLEEEGLSEDREKGKPLDGT